MSTETANRTLARAIMNVQRMGLRTPEEVEQIIIDELQSVRNATLEACAVLAEDTGWATHDAAHDPQEDNSNVTGEKIAATIRSWVTQ